MGAFIRQPAEKKHVNRLCQKICHMVGGHAPPDNKSDIPKLKKQLSDAMLLLR